MAQLVGYQVMAGSSLHESEVAEPYTAVDVLYRDDAGHLWLLDLQTRSSALLHDDLDLTSAERVDVLGTTLLVAEHQLVVIEDPTVVSFDEALLRRFLEVPAALWPVLLTRQIS